MSGSFTPSILRNHVLIKYIFSMVLKSFYIGIVRPPLVELRRSFRNLRAFAQFQRNVSKFETLVNGSSARDFEFGQAHPCLEDRKSAGGSARGHYFHQDLLVAQKIFEAKPERHLDVGSRIDGFVAHVAAFMEVEVVDIRPVASTAQNITFRRFDLMKDDPAELGIFDSVSCLHALEHFGLGRYGDEIDPDGWVKGLSALTKITRSGGTLYLAVPIGPQRIEFDAHRVFSVAFLRSKISEDFSVEKFYYVDDDGDHHDVNVDDLFSEDRNFDCWYGCGIFVLRRK